MEFIKNLNKEAINSLHRNKLLRPFIRNEIIRDEFSKINIEDQLKNEHIKNFIQSQEISSPPTLENWKNKSVSNQEDIEHLALGSLRTKLFAKSIGDFLFTFDKTIATFVDISLLNFSGGTSEVIPSRFSGKIKSPFFDKSKRIFFILSRYCSKIFI